MKCPKCNTDNPDTQRFCGECATSLQPSKEIDVTATIETPKEELTTGSTFARRYQIIEVLGKGGMGRVYKVLDKEVNAKVALKLIKPEIASDKETIERFRNELKVARDIAHKNVCRMYHLSQEEGVYYITMEYVSGEDLKSFIRRSGIISVGKAISIAKQVCEGLLEAHRLGVVHRDLKPQNIMIDKEGNARIMDFGIARSLQAKGITGSGVMIGTPEYMSPEQVEGKEADHRADIYSLGVILYEMVTGRVPFKGDTPFSIGVKQKSESPRPPKEINEQIPDELNQVILKCMEKDKETRFQSVGEVRAELENIEKGIPTSDREIPKRKPLTSREITVTLGLKKFLLPALVFIGIVIIGVVIWQLLPNEDVQPPSSEASLAVLPFDDLSPEKNHEYLCEGISVTLINALSGIKDLHIPSKTSSFSFKGQNLTVEEIGKQLNVEKVLEGTVQVAGDRIRITTQLINVDDGYQLWFERYDKSLEGIFSIQDDIAQKIVNALKIKLFGEKETQIIKHYTENHEAYDLYMHGLYLLNKREIDNLKKAIQYFQKAIGRDSDYALAYSGLAETYVTLGDTPGGDLSSYEAFPKARKEAEKALELDSTLGEAHTTLAQVNYIYDWDWQSAESEFKRAISLNPEYAVAHKEYGEFLTKLTRYDEALKEFERALELDPFSIPTMAIMGWPFHYSGKYNQAIDQYKKALELDPNHTLAKGYLADSYIEKGMYSEVLELYKELDSRHSIIYARMGRISEALQALSDLKKSGKIISPFTIAKIYFELGENDQGYLWLEKAYEDKDFHMAWLKMDPSFKSVHQDLRFKMMLKKVGLEN